MCVWVRARLCVCLCTCVHVIRREMVVDERYVETPIKHTARHAEVDDDVGIVLPCVYLCPLLEPCMHPDQIPRKESV